MTVTSLNIVLGKSNLQDCQDKFLKFLDLINRVYDVSKRKEEVVYDPHPFTFVPHKKRILQDITNLNDSLDDFQ